MHAYGNLEDGIHTRFCAPQSFMASRPRCPFLLPSRTHVGSWTQARTGELATLRRGLAIADESLQFCDSSTGARLRDGSEYFRPFAVAQIRRSF